MSTPSFAIRVIVSRRAPSPELLNQIAKNRITISTIGIAQMMYDMQSISVLKGPAAAALYGRYRNPYTDDPSVRLTPGRSAANAAMPSSSPFSRW